MIAARRLIDVPSTDPEDARRRRLLNILAMGIGGLSLLALIVTIGIDITNAPIGDPASGGQESLNFLYFGSIASVIAIGIVYAINRYWSGWLASALMLLFLGLVLAFGDEPLQVIGGRTLLFFAIPITMASVLISPRASFVVASLVSLALAAIALAIPVVPNYPGTLALFAIALVSWLSARSLETALRELRTINQELDRRVAARTHDLAEALARERAEAGKNQAILEGIADGVIVFDRDALATVANPAVTRLLDRAPGEIAGRSIAELMNGHVSADDQSKISELLNDTNSANTQVKFAWGQRTLSASFAPVQGAPGQVTGTVGVFRDFTHEAEVERMKSAFVSMVSHELRTPLNAIQGYAEMLREAIYGPLLEKQKAAAERILTNTRRLLAIVNDLLDQALVEAGRVKLEIHPFSPAELLEDLRSLVGEMARSKGIEIITNIDAALPERIEGDPQRLNQILINLVTNALKFTEQGSVSVCLSRHDAQRWKIEVTDTGPGIPTEDLTYIFEAFRQVESLSTRQHGGVGLGLSIVQRLVDRMSGEVSVKSEVGRGTTFTIVLPLQLPEE